MESNQSEENSNLPKKDVPVKKTATKKNATKKAPKKNKKRKKDEEELSMMGGQSNLELMQQNIDLFKKLVPNLVINLDKASMPQPPVQLRNVMPKVDQQMPAKNTNNVNLPTKNAPPQPQMPKIPQNSPVVKLPQGNNPAPSNNQKPINPSQPIIPQSIPGYNPQTQNTGYLNQTPQMQPNVPVMGMMPPFQNPTNLQNAPIMQGTGNLNAQVVQNIPSHHIPSNGTSFLHPQFVSQQTTSNPNLSSNGINNSPNIVSNPNNNILGNNNKINTNSNINSNNITNSNISNLSANINNNNNFIPQMNQPPNNMPITNNTINNTITNNINNSINIQNNPNIVPNNTNSNNISNNNNKGSIPQISHLTSHLFPQDSRDYQLVNPNVKKIRPDLTINSLSLQLLIRCLNYLDLNNILEARLVNKMFHRASMECTVWESLHLDTLPKMLISSLEYNREFIWNKICMWPLKRVRKIYFRSEMIDLSVIFSNYIKRLSMILGNNNVTPCIFPNVVEIIEVRSKLHESSNNFQAIVRCIDLGKIEKLKIHFDIVFETLEKMLGVFTSLKSLRVSSLKGDLTSFYDFIYSQENLLHAHFGDNVKLEPSKMIRMNKLESMSWYWDGRQHELFSLANLVNLKCVHLHFTEVEPSNEIVKIVTPYYLSYLSRLHIINEGDYLKYPISIESTNLRQLRFINNTTYEKWKNFFNKGNEIMDIANLDELQNRDDESMKKYQDNYFRTIQLLECPYLTRVSICSVVFTDSMLELLLSKCKFLSEIDLQFTFNEKIVIHSNNLKVLKLHSLARLMNLTLECPALSTLSFLGKFHNSFNLAVTSWAMRQFVFNLNDNEKERVKISSNNHIFNSEDSLDSDSIFVSVFPDNSENTLHFVKLNCPNLMEFACKSNTIELDQLHSLVFSGNSTKIQKISLNLGKTVWREKISKKFTFCYPSVSTASFSCLLNENSESTEELSIFKFPLKMESLINLHLSNFQIKQKWIQQNFYSNSKLTELILDNVYVDTATILFVKEIFASLRVLKLKKLVNTHSLAIRLPTLKHLTLSDCSLFKTFNQFECDSLETFFFFNCPSVENHEISKWKPLSSLKILALGGIRLNLFSVETFPVVFTALKYIHYFPLLTKEQNDLDSQVFFEIILSLNKGYFITFGEGVDEWMTI